MRDARNVLTKELELAMIAYMHSVPTDTAEGMAQALADICHSTMLAVLDVVHFSFDTSEEVIAEFAQHFADDMIELDKRTRE